MPLRNPILRFIFRQMLERPAKRQSFAALIDALEAQGRDLAARAAGAGDTPQNHEQLCHIVGIERWGQRRLQTLLGAPLVLDEYDGYRPDTSLGWNELQVIFAETRTASVALARMLQRSGIGKTATVEHNDAGNVTVGGWIYYLIQHAASESKYIR